MLQRLAARLVDAERLEVEVRLGRKARVADEAEDVACLHHVADGDLRGALCDVGVEREDAVVVELPAAEESEP